MFVSLAAGSVQTDGMSRFHSSARCLAPRRHAGVNERKRVTPHTLRHVFASELFRAGANFRQIRELLGHKHLDSTQRYTRVNAHELRGAIKRLRWVGSR